LFTQLSHFSYQSAPGISTPSISNKRNYFSNKENVIQGIIYISDGKVKKPNGQESNPEINNKSTIWLTRNPEAKKCLTEARTTEGTSPYRAGRLSNGL
jgi:hypothetical protein